MDWKHSPTGIRSSVSRRLSPHIPNLSQKPNIAHRSISINIKEDDGQAKRRRGHFAKFHIVGGYFNWFWHDVKGVINVLNILRRKSRLSLIALFILAIYVTRIGAKLLRTKSLRKSTLRPLPSDPLIPLSIGLFSLHSGSEFPSFSTLRHLFHDGKEMKPCYGSINYHPLKQGQRQRLVREKIKADRGHVYTSEDFEDGNDDGIEAYYAYDDDAVRQSDLCGSTPNCQCRRLSWHRLYHPSCNNFHQMDSREITYLSDGYYNDVWVLSYNDDGDLDLILKTLQYGHKYRFEYYEFVRMDALIMERLTSSNNIVNIYGHCGTSVITEALPIEIESNVIAGEGYISSNPLHDSKHVDPKNDLTPREKLTLALEMAEAIAELHGFKDGLIVHDDVQLCQFLRAKDGTLKLNDFNRAEVMLWNEKNQTYCKYQNGVVYGNFRSPEEFSDSLLDEKIDVYSYGNMVYGILTGLWTFYEDEDDSVVQSKVINGKRAYVDPRYKTNSYGEMALVEIMERCWVHDPKDRADIFEVVKFLRKAAKNYDLFERDFPN